MRLLRLTLVSFFVAASALFASDHAPSNRAVFGLNLCGYADWQPACPFNDLMKQARPWTYSFDRNVPPPPLDALGNWIPEPGKQPFAVVALSTARCPAGLYVVKWEGKGQVGLSSVVKNATVKKQQANRLEMEFGENPTIQLTILASEPADPVRNVQCFVPGSEHAPSQFREAYYKDYHAKFSTFRFMDWMHTNASEQEKWANRPTPEQQTFRLKNRLGTPLEWILDFANLNDADPWLCVPHKADDDYVRHMAEMVRDRMKPGHKVYVEYSNEIWNTAPGFEQTAYSIAMGKTLPQPIPNANIPCAAWYAHRSKQIWDIWDEVFGGREAASKRLVRVAAGFYAVPYISKSKLQAYYLYKSADVFAIAPYAGLNRDIRSGDFDPARFSPEQLEGQIQSQIQGDMNRLLKDNATLAKEMNLPLISYEAGICFATPPKATDVKAATDLIVAASRLPGIEADMEAYIRKWFEYTGGVLMLFVDYAIPGRYGTYDHLGEYPGQPEKEAHRRRAVLRGLNDPRLLNQTNKQRPIP